MTQMFKSYLPLIFIALASIIIISLDLHSYFSFSILQKYHSDLESIVKEHFILSVFLYILVYVTIVALSIPVATFLTITGGLIFGQILGTFLAVFSASCGAVILFLAIRYASVNFAYKGKFTALVQKIRQGIKNNVFFYLLFLRLTPIFPFVAINIASAVLRIPLVVFFSATFIGIIPATYIFASFGASLTSLIQVEDLTYNTIIESKALILLGVLGIISIIPVLYSHKKTGDK
ncbi:MAG TPA: VTT domain-containing protein [Candidatus Megaira endosymbiont of Nemacystus decipiens]|nr:VTT domain-containing protein [Candidatus Megaera endosymbiont of Nemacystus decipiens]